MEKNIYIIHENDEWLVPLRESFKKIKAPFKEWHMDKQSFDFKKSSSITSDTTNICDVPSSVSVVVEWSSDAVSSGNSTKNYLGSFCFE